MNSLPYAVCFSLLCLNIVQGSNTDARQPRILNQESLPNSNRRYQDDYINIEQQNIEASNYNNKSSIDTTIDDVIEEIIDSNRQGRNIEGLDEVYSDPSVAQALTAGDDGQARNIIRDKLCTLGLMECEKPRPVYYVNPPNNRPQYPPFKQIQNPNGIYRPPQPIKNANGIYGPPQPIKNTNGIYGPPQPVALHGNHQNPQPSPPRKIGFEPSSNYNNFYSPQPSKPHDKYSTEIFEHDSASSVKFGYTEKPTIVVNQGKREAPAVSQNTHIHHHYVHSDGQTANDGLKTVFANTPISEYSTANAESLNSQSLYGLSSNLKPVSEGYSINGNQNQYSSFGNQYSSGNNQFAVDQNSFSQKSPQVFTDSSNNNNNNGLYTVGASYHATQPDIYKKELNLNGNRDSSYNNIQQSLLSSQNKYSNKYQQVGEEDCICVPADQCPIQEIVRRDDLILPIDPRNLPIDIEAEVDNSNTTLSTQSDVHSNTTDHKISKRQVKTSSDNESRLGGYPASYGYPNSPGGKRIIPTLGVSFGLPVPSYGGYPITPFSGHVQNPNFGAFGYNPNGLNLGLINVNPLLSLQVTKSEINGQKLVKPFINLHVTPNKGIVDGIGGLFHAKKNVLHKHLHLHRYPHPPYPPPPFIDHSPEFVHPPFPHQPIIEGPPFPPPHFPPPHQPHFHGPPPLPPPHLFESHINSFPPPDYIGLRNNQVPFANDLESHQNYESGLLLNNDNKVKDDYRFRYARNYQDLKSNQNFVQSIPAAAPGGNEGSEFVSFPSSRRRRDTDQAVPSSIDGKQITEEHEENVESENTGRALNGIKRQAYNSFSKQCTPKFVCCRRPIRQSQVSQVTQYQNQIHQQQQHQQQQQQPQYHTSAAKTNRCGVRNSQGINGRIKNPSYVDGDSEFAEYPWQVAILKKDPKESVYVCGGTLIDENHILTAAHCVKTYSGFDLRVRMGEWDVNHDVEFYPYVERDVISVHVHPQYYAGTLENDLAILRINQPVDLASNPHINTACMPDRNTDYSGQRCWTTGWGKNNWEFGKYQNILKEVDVPIIDHNTCQNQMRQTRLGYQFVLNPGFLCAGGEEGKDACRGDGGGPLVCERNGSWQVVGIVSWGIGCGKQNVPGVYVKVSHYLEWIYQITQRV